MLPKDTAEAAELARLHDKKLKYGVWRDIDAARPLRYAIETRHPTFLVPEFFALLREYKVAFVFADAAGKWPYAEDLTADFVYIRLHGATDFTPAVTRILSWIGGARESSRGDTAGSRKMHG